MDCATQCPSRALAQAASSAVASSAEVALPGQWWTPQTAPAATGLVAGDPTLRALLEKVAINGEVLVAGSYTPPLLISTWAVSVTENP